MTREEKLKRFRKLADETTLLRQAVVEQCGPMLCELAEHIAGVLGSQRKILLVGNGVSAATASLLATQLMVRLSPDKKRQALPAISLAADAALVSSASEEFGYDESFARQIEGLGVRGDMLIVIATGGNAPNLIRAVQTAHEMGILTFGLLGGMPGKLVRAVDRSIVIPQTSSLRVQEEHLFLIHLLVELIESDLLV